MARWPVWGRKKKDRDKDGDDVDVEEEQGRLISKNAKQENEPQMDLRW